MTPIRISSIKANLLGLGLMVLLVFLSVVLYVVLPHRVPFSSPEVLYFLVATILLTPLHEGVHALGFLYFGKVSYRNIRFGILWKFLTPYCHCTVPLPADAFRKAIMLPFWVTSLVTMVPFFISPHFWVGALGGFALGACAGDLLYDAALRKTPGDAWVYDSPDSIGCTVYPPGERPQITGNNSA